MIYLEPYKALPDTVFIRYQQNKTEISTKLYIITERI